jgi:hypothetical protein
LSYQPKPESGAFRPDKAIADRYLKKQGNVNFNLDFSTIRQYIKFITGEYGVMVLS